MNCLFLIFLWGIWCTIHSVMISLSFTNFLKTRLGKYFKYYRIFYNVVSIMTIIPPIFFSILLRGPVLYSWSGYMIGVRFVFALLVILFFILGGLKYDVLQVIGIRQIKSGKSHSTITENGEIDTTGVLSITRHPWYLSTLIFIWIYYNDLYVSTLIANIVLTIYLIIGTILEEKKLVVEFGQSYLDYKNKVPMLLPTKWIFSIFAKQLGHVKNSRFAQKIFLK